MYCANVFRDHRLFYKRVYVLRSACTVLFSERRVYDVMISDRSFYACCKVRYYKAQTPIHNCNINLLIRAKIILYNSICFDLYSSPLIFQILHPTNYVRNLIAGSIRFELSYDVNIFLLPIRLLICAKTKFS